MAVTYSTEEGLVATPVRPIDAGAIADLKRVERTFNLATQTTSDTLSFHLPSGFRPMLLLLIPSATLGSSTISIGPSGTLSKYRAAAVLTAPSIAALPLAADGKLTAAETNIITIAAASLPASGTLKVIFLGTND